MVQEVKFSNKKFFLFQFKKFYHPQNKIGFPNINWEFRHLRMGFVKLLTHQSPKIWPFEFLYVLVNLVLIHVILWSVCYYTKTLIWIFWTFFHSPRASALQKDWFVSLFNGNGCWSLLGHVKGKWSEFEPEIKPGTGQPLSPCWGGTICEFV